MTKQLSKRVRYFLGHLVVSALVSLCAVLWVFFVWYPTPLGKAVGLTSIFLMMVAIDVIIGPLLSFVVYKEGKKTLKMDLVIIALLQLSALCYGMFQIAQGRPVWIVYNVDRFELVRYHEIYEGAIDKADPKYRQPTWFTPKYVATAFATDPAERGDNTLEEVVAGISLAQRPERYVEIDKAYADINKRKLSLTDLTKYNPKTQVETLLKKYPTAHAYLPLRASQLDMVVLVDEKAQVVKIVDLRPWEVVHAPKSK